MISFNSIVAYSKKVFAADPRFVNIQTDPRFRLPSKKNTHVRIDKRFAHMLGDERFSSKAKVDRYGRKLPKNSGRKELERYYRVEEDGDSGENLDVPHTKKVEKGLARVERVYDPARDGGFSSSTSDESSDTDSSDVGEEEIEFTDEQGPENGDVPAGEVTSRIAVVNLDWDNIRAADLMAVFSSFTPTSKRILKVSIYPSDFGKQRMEREEMEGPPKDIFNVKKSYDRVDLLSLSDGEDNSEDSEEEDEKIKRSMLKEDQGEEFDPARLRRYQLERLRYYYAVLECSSKSAAESIYNKVDGTEYLTTANFFDLRFIPEDMDFSDDRPRDECESVPHGYKPNQFVTDALQHSKVRLTWDADDITRKEVQRRAFAGSRADIDQNDLKAYLGSDSSDEDEEEEEEYNTIATDVPYQNIISKTAHIKSIASGLKFSKKDAERKRMRALLGLNDEPELSKSSENSAKAPVGNMQITFSSGLSSGKRGSVFENEPIIEETTVEKYVRKEKERKARRKEKMKNAREGKGQAGDAEVLSEEEASADPGDMGFEDPFFTAPADNQAAAVALRKEEKRQKRTSREADEGGSAKQRAELELLLVDDDTNSKNTDKSASVMNHFNINELVKAEKALKKKGRKLTTREKEALEAKERDDFKMDVQDPRFSAVFERSEFAIDPSNPKFKGTGGMKALLEEGRRKRKAGEIRDEGSGKEKIERKKKKGGETGDLQKLVAKIKGKAKRV